MFVNVVDKIIEPMAQYKLTFEELKQVTRLLLTRDSFYSLLSVLDGLHSSSC